MVGSPGRSRRGNRASAAPEPPYEVSRRGVWTIPDSLDAQGAAAFSQLEVLLPAPPSGRIPAFPLRVHRLLRRFAQVIHMLTGAAGQQCCCRACVTRRPRRTLGPGADEIVQEGTDARHALQGGRSVYPPGACRYGHLASWPA